MARPAAGAVREGARADREIRLDIQLAQQELDEKKAHLIPVERVVLEGQTYTKGWTTELLTLPRVAVQSGAIAPDQEAGVATLCRDLAERIAGWKSVPDVDHRLAQLAADPAA